MEKLAKNDLGEGTLQTQRDTLKDIESLIKRSETPPQGGGQQNQKQGGGGGEDQNPKDKKDQQGSSGGQKSQATAAAVAEPAVNRIKTNSLLCLKCRRHSQGTAGNPEGKAPPRNPAGNNAGARNQATRRPAVTVTARIPAAAMAPAGTAAAATRTIAPCNRNADLYKDVWGHLPETLRARWTPTRTATVHAQV